MGTLNFDQVDIIINGSGIICDSVTLDHSNSLEPQYALGYRSPINESQNGPISNKIQLNYFLEMDNEPSFAIINSIKTLTGSPFLYSGVTISMAGITGYNCYLDNYSIKISPNSVIKASASFSCFSLTSGQISNKYQNIQYNTGNSLGNGVTVYVMSSGGFINTPTYEISYSFTANWEPVYKIGQNIPFQVNLQGGIERFTLLRDAWYNFGFTGEKSDKRFLTISSNDYAIDITTIGIMNNTSYKTLNLDVSGCYIKNQNLDIGVDDIVKTLTSIEKAF